MAEKKHILSHRQDDVTALALTSLTGHWENHPTASVYEARLEWVAKRDLPTGVKYKIVTTSELPPNLDDYSWTWDTDYDGFASGSYVPSGSLRPVTGSFNPTFKEYCEEKGII